MTYSASKDYIKKYQTVIDRIEEYIQLTGEQEEFYLKWCKNEIGFIKRRKVPGSFPRYLSSRILSREESV